MDKAFVGRQPIYKSGVDVFAYELVSRNHELDQAAFANGDKFTAEDLLEEFIDGLEWVVGRRRAFVNVSRDFILNDHCSALPRKNVVLQVAGDTPSDDALLGTLSGLSSAGYTIALNNFEFHDEIPSLAMVADIVKLN